MTKYILAGGRDRASKSYWNGLAKNINSNEPLSILSCFFAEPREAWESKYDRIKPYFLKTFGKDATIELAFPDKFRSQVKKADIIYLHGGDDTLLGHYLHTFKDLAKIFEDKIIVGSSAGASFLSAKYWTCDWRQVRQGSGLTPLNVIVHYGSNFGSDDPRGSIDWRKAEYELQNAVGSNEKVTFLREGKFVVFEK